MSEATNTPPAQETNGKLEDGIVRENGKMIFVADGEKYVVDPFDQKDLKFAREHLATLKKGPMDAILTEIEKISLSPHLNDETKARLQERLIDKAYPDLREILPSKKDTVAWLETLDGNLYAMSFKLRKRHTNMDEEKALDIVAKASAGQMIHKLRKHLPDLSKDDALEIIMRIGSERFHGLREEDLKRVAEKMRAEQQKEAIIPFPAPEPETKPAA